MSYPKVLDEDATLDAAIAGASISRFGDGELRITHGGSSASQVADGRLSDELKRILCSPSKALVCIPTQNKAGPRAVNWSRYAHEKFTRLYQLPLYGSAFITRPDSAPWINRPDYWAKVKKLWFARDVVIVTGELEGSNKMYGIGDDARSVRRVMAPRQHAFAEIDRIEDEIGRPEGVVILCLGATATVLAVRLANNGVQAIDLGHIGMFMRRQSITKPEGL